MSPALAGRFFTTGGTWEAHVFPIYAYIFNNTFDFPFIVPYLIQSDTYSNYLVFLPFFFFFTDTHFSGYGFFHSHWFSCTLHVMKFIIFIIFLWIMKFLCILPLIQEFLKNSLLFLYIWDKASLCLLQSTREYHLSLFSSLELKGLICSICGYSRTLKNT